MVRTDIDGVKCDYLSQKTWIFEHLTVSSDFCSGNLAHAESDDGTQLDLRTCADMQETPHSTNYRTWFHYSVSGAKKDETIVMCISNLNPQAKMYNQGLKPVYRVGAKGKWERLNTEVTHSCGENKNFQIKFRFRFSGSTEPTFFAFSYPYSFEEVCRRCDEIEKACAATSSRADAAIYCCREVLTRSLEGRRVELLTISDSSGMSSEREAPIPGLFPDAKPDSRPFVFAEKKVYYLSARVHPGESPAQWMWEGFVDFLVNRDDPRAKALRKLFVFKIVPIINPDGVARGHYRADTMGLNLNRSQPHNSLWLTLIVQHAAVS